MRVAIDAGGTFTDVAIIDESGRLSSHKALSHPDDPARGMLNALDESVAVDQLTSVVNGTTAGLNAVLSRRGTRVLVVTTHGFRDILSIGRAHREDIWELRYPMSEHLVTREDIYPVVERVLADGSVDHELDIRELDRIAEVIETEGIRAVAICFLHATTNPVHERAVKKYFAERCPLLLVSMSHEVAPEIGEYERFSSTVVNAYVATTVGEYLRSVTAGLAGRGYEHPLLVMRSSGGVTSARSAEKRPMQTLLSGPAGGVIGAETLARHLRLDHLLAVDMGGTSLDASVIVNQRLAVRADLDIDGIPVLMPVVDLVTVSAGGGSIAWTQHGALHVGPHSAGGAPGPACYGLGGTQPTVTDANVLLGRLGHARLAGDALSLDRAAAEAAFEPVAAELGLTVEEAAQAVLDITDARMADALRAVTVRRGHDPRDFVILAFGGAGPLHAAALAEELGITSVIVPPAAGVFSAWGMLHAPVRHDLAQPLLASVAKVHDDELRDIHDELQRRAQDLLREDGIDPATARFASAADLRYAGQQFSITIELPIGTPVSEWDQRFRNQYEQVHGAVAGDPPAEFVNVRVTAIGPAAGIAGEEEVREGRPSSTGAVIHGGIPLDATVCDRGALMAPIAGPAVISDPGSTIYVAPGWSAMAGPMGTVVMNRIKE